MSASQKACVCRVSTVGHEEMLEVNELCAHVTLNSRDSVILMLHKYYSLQEGLCAEEATDLLLYPPLCFSALRCSLNWH